MPSRLGGILEFGGWAAKRARRMPDDAGSNSHAGSGLAGVAGLFAARVKRDRALFPHGWLADSVGVLFDGSYRFLFRGKRIPVDSSQN